MFIRNYDKDEVKIQSAVTEIHWDDGRVVQISGSEDEDLRGQHVLIRVWPKNGTAEYGGHNLESFSCVLRPDGEGWRIEALDARAWRGQ